MGDSRADPPCAHLIQTTSVTTGDVEIDGIGLAVVIFERLPEDARRRAIEYLSARFLPGFPS